jgi:tetratricopeptide (TPR) repeat protein
MSLMRTLPLALSLLWVSPAAAQYIPETEPEVVLTPEARAAQAAELKGKATAAFSAGSYELALERIERAIELSDDAGLVANKGLILEKMGRFKEAAAAFRTYLAAASAGGPKAKKAKALLARLEPEVTITTTPPGATIAIQGEAAPLGSTPLTKRVAAGTHLFLVNLAGYQKVRKVGRVVPGKGLKLALTLEKTARPPPPSPPAGGVTGDGGALKATKEVATASRGQTQAWAWISLGSAALAAGAAGLFYTQGLDAATARDAATRGAAWDAEQSTLEQKNTLYLASGGVAILAGLVGTYLLFSGSDGSPATLSAVPGSAILSIEF